jgi:acetyl-CoA carboxylase carboxyl transferase subunit alpha
MRHFLDFEKPIAELEGQIEALRHLSSSGDLNIADEVARLEAKADRQLRQTYARLSPWQKVQVARHPERPHAGDYIAGLISEFTPLAGDRGFAEDRAIVGGIGRFRGRSVVVIGHEKGADTDSRVRHNFGMARPEGYRKARRLMELAERFALPVLALVDTAGAYPGIGAEERGQAESIARNLMEMSRLRTPIISVVTGEGGSGGALGIGIADRVAMMEFAWYSVISPEACSSILFKGNEEAAQLAESLKLTSRDLRQLGVIDAIVPEPLGGAHRDRHSAAHNLEQYIAKSLRELKRFKIENLLERRYEKFRNLGVIAESSRRHAGRAAG